MHRWSVLIIVQRNATQSSLFIILQVHSTCFGCQPHTLLGVHKTVTTASGTGLVFCAATSLQNGQASLATLEGGSCTVPEAVVTVLCTPVDGCGWHPKHAEWTCRIINRLLCVASRWTIINIDLKEQFPLSNKITGISSWIIASVCEIIRFVTSQRNTNNECTG